MLATIFVNPLQFGPNEDFARYPRTLDADLRTLSDAGADAVYVPTAADLYPEGFSTHVEPPAAAAGYEGKIRPGHFRGVATVVLKLWNRTRPARAYFSRKDAQQVAVVDRVARDLDLRGETVRCAIVRDPDGLALSSRNRYLSASERARALAIPRSLEALVLRAARGERRDALLAAARERLEASGLTVDYVDLVDPETMAPTDLSSSPALAIVAARAGTTRLLDNRYAMTAGPLRP